jgi:hypothetical protein
LDVEQFKCPSTLTAFLYFIKQKSAIRRNSKGSDRRVDSRAPIGRIDEDLVWPVWAFAKINAGLFLSWLPFPEEVPSPNLLDRIMGFDIHQFANSIPNAVAPWNAIEIRTRIQVLCIEPSARAWRILVFEPPVRVGKLNTVQDLCDSVDRGEWWRRHQLRHGDLRSAN